MTAGATPEERWRLGYRPALDGLRGVAILLVVAAHYGVPFLPDGGTAGVTIFFVLSGFLITSLLLEERAETGGIRWAAFYGRRARRLLPALLVTVAIVLVLGQLFDDPIVWPQALAAMGYIANLFPVQEPLGHAWTLSVEEQYYIAWPAIVIAAMWGGRASRWMLLAVTATVAAVFMAGPYQLSAFGAIGVGSLLGVVAVLWWPPRLPIVLTAISAATILAIATTPFGAVMLPPLRVAVVIAAGILVLGAATSNVHFLSSAWLRWIGEISYGLYLVHVPVRWALTEAGVDATWSAGAAVGVAVSVGAAALLYHRVERPVRARFGGRRAHHAGRAIPAPTGTPSGEPEPRSRPLSALSLAWKRRREE